ncbi:MAG: DUF3800 domain-containing protein [Candidatus Bipolaricaulia bacterium]
MKRYRFYIDESGDHTFKELTYPAKRYLGLIGCFVEAEVYRTQFHPAFEDLKQAHFPHNPDEPVILHRTALINKRGPFRRLHNPEAERRFNEAFLQFLFDQEYRLIAVVIDKKTHVERYGDAADHPYHYCLTVLLERYCGFLNHFNAEGDVMAESRGGREDRQLKAIYRQVYESGTYFHNAEFFQRVLTSKEIKLKPKSANIAGLQVGDLLAHPCKQEILITERRTEDPSDTFGRKICRCVEPKYNRRYSDDRVKGYGQVFLG